MENFMKMTTFLALILLLASCGKSELSSTEILSSSIMSGTKIDSRDELGKVTVGVTDADSTKICTGSIISSNIILTAAHCVEKQDAKKMRIVFGSKITDSKNTVKVEAVAVHKDYFHNTSVGNDLALIKIEGTVPSKYKVLDIERSSLLTLEKGTPIQVAGFGKNKTGFFGGGAGTLRKGQVSLDQYSAEEKLLVLDQSNENGICNGDSGGGAFVEVDGELVQLGVNSYVPSKKKGSSTGDCKSKSYLTNIAFYLDWIQMTMAELN